MGSRTLSTGAAYAHTSNVGEQGDSNMNIESTLSSEITVYKYTDTKRRDNENSAILLELVRARDKPSFLTYISRAAGALR